MPRLHGDRTSERAVSFNGRFMHNTFHAFRALAHSYPLSRDAAKRAASRAVGLCYTVAVSAKAPRSGRAFVSIEHRSELPHTVSAVAET